MPRRPKHRIEARKVFVPAGTVPVACIATLMVRNLLPPIPLRRDRRPAGQNEHGHPALTATARSDSGTEAGISDET